jgi:hypothetical protein
MSDSSSNAPYGTVDDLNLPFLEHPLTLAGSRRNALVPQIMTEGVGIPLETTGMPLTNPQQQPIVTLASTLRPTTYDEKNEAEGTTRTLEYVRVQRALLEYLDKKPADSLNARQARRWTQAIDPAGNKKPKAADALRLCYYMRSQGYDTYARVKNRTVSCFVVKQTTRNHEHVLYWKQDVVTDEVLNAPDAQPLRTRRNAIHDGPSFLAAAPRADPDMERIFEEADTAVMDAITAELERDPPDAGYLSPLAQILEEYRIN